MKHRFLKGMLLAAAETAEPEISAAAETPAVPEPQTLTLNGLTLTVPGRFCAYRQAAPIKPASFPSIAVTSRAFFSELLE